MAFVSVNDVYVMRAWEESQGAKGKVLMLSDGNGDLSAAVRERELTEFCLQGCAINPGEGRYGRGIENDINIINSALVRSWLCLLAERSIEL